MPRHSSCTGDVTSGVRLFVKRRVSLCALHCTVGSWVKMHAFTRHDQFREGNFTAWATPKRWSRRKAQTSAAAGSATDARPCRSRLGRNEVQGRENDDA